MNLFDKNMKLFDKNSYKYIILILVILVLGMLLYGNYNLIEGATNGSVGCTVDNTTLGNTSDLGTSGANSASNTLNNIGQMTTSLASRNNLCN